VSRDNQDAGTYCPSSVPDPGEPEATVLGVVGGTPEKPSLVYLSDPVPVTPELLDRLGGVPAADVLRIAAPCRESACSHFRDAQCSLITKIVRAMPETAPSGPDGPDASVPACHLRDKCRWWRQEKVAACRRCPVITTDQVYATELQWWIADPATSAEDFDPREFIAAGAEPGHGG
jgi:hypothetical protein